METNNWLKTKKATGLFAVVAFIGGFFFLNQGITGNAVSNESVSAFNPVFLVGMLLILCSVVLAVYAVKKK